MPPTPVFLPEKSHGQRNLVGYSPWGCKELDTTESLSLQVEYTVKSKPQLLTDSYKESKDFPVAQTVKNMPAMQETKETWV